MKGISLFRHREYLLAFEVGGYRLGRVNLVHRTGQHILIKKEEIGVFARADTTSFILDEHLLGNIDGHGCERLFASGEFFWPPRITVLRPKNSSHGNLHDAEWVVGAAAQCRIV